MEREREREITMDFRNTLSNLKIKCLVEFQEVYLDTRNSAFVNNFLNMLCIFRLIGMSPIFPTSGMIKMTTFTCRLIIGIVISLAFFGLTTFVLYKDIHQSLEIGELTFMTGFLSLQYVMISLMYLVSVTTVTFKTKDLFHLLEEWVDVRGRHCCQKQRRMTAAAIFYIAFCIFMFIFGKVYPLLVDEKIGRSAWNVKLFFVEMVASICYIVFYKCYSLACLSFMNGMRVLLIDFHRDLAEALQVEYTYKTLAKNRRTHNRITDMTCLFNRINSIFTVFYFQSLVLKLFFVASYMALESYDTIQLYLRLLCFVRIFVYLAIMCELGQSFKTEVRVAFR